VTAADILMVGTGLSNKNRPRPWAKCPISQEVIMKQLIRTLFILSLLFLFPLAASADEMVSLKVGYVSLSADGSIASRESGVVDTKIDLEDDLDFDDSNEVMAEAALQFGAFRLALGYLPLNFSGTANLSQNISFGGETFAATDTVKGKLDVDIYDLGLTWYVINFDDLPTRIQIGPELSLKVLDGEISLSDRTTGMREEISGTVPVPTVGLRGRIGISDYLALIGRVGYVQYNDNSFLDADAQIEFSPLPMVGAFGGYRYLDIDVDESDFFIDSEFSGPYGGVFVRF
jgi:hypothetical protein